MSHCLFDTSQACDSAPEWRYYWDIDDYRLQKEGTDQCFGRYYNSALGDSNVAVVNSTTGLAPCPSIDTFAYYLLTLDGEENNEFVFNINDGAGDYW